MKRIMVCDDDKAMALRLVSALERAGYEAASCNHTMDVLREAAGGNFSLVALSLDIVGFGRGGAAEALREIAPHTPLIGFYNKHSDTLHTATRACFSHILPRPVSDEDFMRAVANALDHPQARAATVAVQHHGDVSVSSDSQKF